MCHSFSDHANIEVPAKKPKLEKNGNQIKKGAKTYVTTFILSIGAANTILQKAAKAKFFTGLDEYDRNSVWELLPACKENLSMLNKNSKSGTMRSVSVSCQFLLTLTILRRNYGYQEAGYLFKINNADIVQCVFKTWLIFMFKEFSDPVIRKRLFVLYEDLPKPPPKPFDNPVLEKTRGVLDATLLEVIIKVSQIKKSWYRILNLRNPRKI